MSDATDPPTKSIEAIAESKFTDKERRKEEKRALKKKEKKERLKAQRKEDKRRKKREDAKLKGEELLEPLLETEEEDDDDSDGDLGMSMGGSESELETDGDGEEDIPMVTATVIDDSSTGGVSEQKESSEASGNEKDGESTSTSIAASGGTTAAVPSIDLSPVKAETSTPISTEGEETAPVGGTTGAEASTVATEGTGENTGEGAVEEGADAPVVEITPRTEARINDTLSAALVEHGIVVEDKQDGAAPDASSTAPTTTASTTTAASTTATTTTAPTTSASTEGGGNDDGNGTEKATVRSPPKSPVLSNPTEDQDDDTLISSMSSAEVSQLQSELDTVRREKEESLKAIEDEKKAILAEKEQLAAAMNAEKSKAASLEKEKETIEREKEAVAQEVSKHKEELLKAESERNQIIQEKAEMQQALEKEMGEAARMAREKAEMEMKMAQTAELHSLQNSTNDAMLAELEKEKEERAAVAMEVVRLKEEGEIAELRLQQESEMKERLAKEHEEAQAILDKERRETALLHEQFAQEKELLAERAEREIEEREKRIMEERDDMESKLGAEMERIRLEQEERDRLMEEERAALDEERARKEREIEAAIRKAEQEKKAQEAVMAAEKASIALSIQQGVQAEKEKLNMDFSASEEASKKKKLESILAKEAARERSLKLRADARSRRMQEVAKRRALENSKHGVANEGEAALAIEVLGSGVSTGGRPSPKGASPGTYKALNTTNPYSDSTASPHSRGAMGDNAPMAVAGDMNDDLEDSHPGADYSAAMINVEGTLMSPQRPANPDQGKTKPSPSKSPALKGSPTSRSKSPARSPRSAGSARGRSVSGSPERAPSADVSVGRGGLSPSQIAQRAVAASLAYSEVKAGGSTSLARQSVDPGPTAVSYHTNSSDGNKRVQSKYPMTEKRMKAKQLYELQKAANEGADPGTHVSIDNTESGIAYRTAPATGKGGKGKASKESTSNDGKKGGKKSPRGTRTPSRSPTREITHVSNLDPQPPSPRGGKTGGYKVHKERSKLPSQLKKERQRELALHSQNRYSEDDEVNAAIADVIASHSPNSQVPPDLHAPRVARRGGSPSGSPGSPSPPAPQGAEKGLATSTSSPGSLHKGRDASGGERLPQISNKIKSHQIRKVRNSFAPEELYDDEGHLIVENTSRVRAAHLGGLKKAKKPLYKRLEEMKNVRDAEDERQRQEEHARYRIDRARAQPTREEIEQHMRDHSTYHTRRSQQKALSHPASASFHPGLASIGGSGAGAGGADPGAGAEVRSAAFAAYFNGEKGGMGDKGELKARYEGINGGVATSNGGNKKGGGKGKRDWSYLDNLPEEGSTHSLSAPQPGHNMPTHHGHKDQYDHEPNPALLRTRYKQAAREEIAARKHAKLVEEEEKRDRIEAKRRYSEAVRENLLESPAYKPKPSKGNVGFETDKNYNYDHGAGVDSYNIGSGYSPKKLMMSSVDDAMRVSYDTITSYTSSPHNRMGGAGGGGRGGKTKGAGFRAPTHGKPARLPPSSSALQDLDPQSLSLSPRSSKTGTQYISEVIESKDVYERKMAQVYESGFEQFFRRK